jgi:hypothetical protein
VLQTNHRGRRSCGFGICRVVFIVERKNGGAGVSGREPITTEGVVHENHTKDHRSYNRFKENNSKEREKAHVNCVSKESSSEEDNEVCVVEWVDTPKEKPVSCSFLRPNPDKKDEVKFTFDVSKCDKLFDVLA